jgi:hypothetical protein
MGRMVPTDGNGSFWPSSFAGKGGAVGPLFGGGGDKVLINRPALNILCLENLGLPGWQLSVTWDRWW